MAGNTEKSTEKKKDTRGVKPGVRRGPYEKKEGGCRQELDTAFKRIQALEDIINARKKEEPASEAPQPEIKPVPAPGAPKEEDDEWL